MIFAILVGVVVVLAYLLNNYLLSFWSRHGIEQLDAKFFIGNAGPLLTRKISTGEFFQGLYNKHKQHKMVGIYMSYRPMLVVNDAKLVQNILIKDFKSFHDRPMPVDEKNDPLSAHLFSVAGQKWRDLRIKLTPIFTSGKLKEMFPIIRSVGQVLEDYVTKNVETGVDVFEIRDLMARYSTNIISSVAFGIDNDCINEPDHIFRRMGMKFFDTTFMTGIRNLLTFLGHTLLHKLKMKTLDSEVESFMLSVVKQNVEYRESANFARNDFMQLLIQLKNQGFVAPDEGEKTIEDGKEENAKNKLTMAELSANVFLFFIAGKNCRLI